MSGFSGFRSLEEVHDLDALRDASRSILTGYSTDYEAATRGIGRSYELIVREIERLREVKSANGHKRAEALLDGARDAAAEIAEAIESGRELRAPAAELIDGWSALAGLVGSRGLGESARHLFEVCSSKLDVSRRMFLAAAEAVTSTFPSVDDGLAFWKDHLQGQARHYAIDYIIRHNPGDPVLAPALTGLFVGALEGFTTADAEMLLAEAAEARGSETAQRGEARTDQHFIVDVLAAIPINLRPGLNRRLAARSFSQAWVRQLEQAEAVAANVDAPSSDLLAMLNDQGVDPGDFRPHADHPLEIREAIEDYLDEEEDLRGISQARIVELRRIDYPKFHPEFLTLSEKFRNGIDALKIAEEDVFGGDVAPSENLISDLDSRFAHNAKVLLLIGFFFRTKARRRDLWQVIPVGRQRAFGIVIPQQLVEEVWKKDLASIDSEHSRGATDPLSVALAKMAKAGGDIQTGGITWSTSATIEFLKPIFALLNERKGSISCRPGFVMGDLLVEMFKQSRKGAGTVPMIHTLLTRWPQRDVRDESGLDIFPQFTDAGQTQLPFDDCRLKDRCALFDLGQKKVIDLVLSHKDCKEKYCILVVCHGLDIPLGVGFSLPLLPALLRKGNWGRTGDKAFLYNEIYQLAVSSFVKIGDGEAAIEEFLEWGIDLTEIRDHPDFARRNTVIQAANRFGTKSTKN